MQDGLTITLPEGAEGDGTTDLSAYPVESGDGVWIFLSPPVGCDPGMLMPWDKVKEFRDKLSEWLSARGL